MWNFFKVNNKGTIKTLITCLYCELWTDLHIAPEFPCWLWTSKCRQWRLLNDITYWCGKKIRHPLSLLYGVTRQTFLSSLTDGTRPLAQSYLPISSYRFPLSCQVIICMGSVKQAAHRLRGISLSGVHSVCFREIKHLM